MLNILQGPGADNSARQGASSSFYQQGDMKPRLFSTCVVAAPCNTYSIAADLRLAGRKNPSVSFVTLLVKRTTYGASSALIFLLTSPMSARPCNLGRNVVINAPMSLMLLAPEAAIASLII